MLSETYQTRIGTYEALFPDIEVPKFESCVAVTAFDLTSCQLRQVDSVAENKIHYRGLILNSI